MKQVQFGLMMILFLAFSCKGKAQKNDLLVGKWQSYKKESRDKKQTYKADTLDGYLFTQDGFHCYYFNGKEASKNKYLLNNDTIFYGFKPVYVVEKLDEEELVLLEIFRSSYTSKSDRREYFRKVEKFNERPSNKQ